MIEKNVDAFYVKGDGHMICQDYAFSGTDGVNYFAVLADGCSSSENTDVGARVLCMAFIDAFKTFTLIGDSFESEEFDTVMSKQVSQYIIDSASKWSEGFDPLRKQKGDFLDATLFGIFATEKKVYVGGWGDGFVVADSKEKFEVTEIDFTSGAPYYLSYLRDENRMAVYENMTEGSTVYEHGVWSTPMMKGEDSITIDAMTIPHFWKVYDITEDEMVISVLSDGVGSFKEKGKGEVISEMTSFKNYKGEFVHRRLGSFKKKCVKEGITHYDDLSCASLHIKNVEEQND
jgi:hypothetical protein